MGEMYAQGFGVKKDFKKAMEYYIKASKNGNPNGQYLVGQFYEKISKEPKKAIKWYKKAAAQGFQKAKQRLQTLCKRYSQECKNLESI
jgi:TPR repeat protein